MSFDRTISTELDGVDPFAPKKLNSSRTRDDVPSVIVLKRRKQETKPNLGNQQNPQLIETRNKIKE
jgi:hypothetical protein